MRTDSRVRRPLIFFAVLLLHVALIVVLSRARPIILRLPVDLLQLLVFAPTAPRAAPSLERSSRAHALKRDAPDRSAPDNSITVPEIPRAPPPIDWDKEVELAAQNALSRADKEAAYRNLAALTPAQRDWLQRNHLEPAPPGVTWGQPRVEVTPGGFPIIHINDHCVAIPFLMMMVFCKIGHIEPNGKLFEHMRDARQ